MDKFDAARCQIETPSKSLPLHRFTPRDVCNTIKQWLLNDVDYRKNLKRTMKIFSDASVSGGTLQMQLMPIKMMELLVRENMLKCVSMQTLTVILDGFEGWRASNKADVVAQPVPDIAYRVFQMPLNALMNKIADENVSGEQFIALVKSQSDFIADETGWNDDDIHQLTGCLMSHHTLMRPMLIEHVTNALETNGSPVLYF